MRFRSRQPDPLAAQIERLRAAWDACPDASRPALAAKVGAVADAWLEYARMSPPAPAHPRQVTPGRPDGQRQRQSREIPAARRGR
jgi:hypothetical protein